MPILHRHLARRSRPCRWRAVLVACAVLFLAPVVHPSVGGAADAAGASALPIVRDHHTDAVIVLAPTAGGHERQAATDLAKYIEAITGARPAVAEDPAAITTALAGTKPLLIIGEEALRLRPDLRQRLQAVAKPHPFIRADAIVLQRDNNRVYLAGTNDDSHYFAVVELLKRWGVRWYMPGPFGECVPTRADLDVGSLDIAYAPPFEVRTFWLSWLGDPAGQADFTLRNGMTDPRSVPSAGHALGQYTKGLGKTDFDIALTAPATAAQVAKGVEPLFAKGADFSLAMEDGIYASSDPNDIALENLQWDPSTLHAAVTDPMLQLYGNVLGILRRAYPDSRSRIGFLAYSNMTLPPVRAVTIDPALFAELAPIDVDPNHGMDDRRSPQRQAYRDVMTRWASVMNKRVIIYDYDQSMLVWRDLPNPSHVVFRQDVQHYRQAGILGIDTESRGALATTFLNLYLRSRLMWDPDTDIDAVLAEFFPRFYGPAAAPMRDYWQTIFDAWAGTLVTEHEYFVAPAIYTPVVVERLRGDLAAAERLVAPLAATKPDELVSTDKLVLDRLRFTRLGFEVIDGYMAMVRAAATDADFPAAVAAGRRGLAARDALTAMNPTFTAPKLEQGDAWWAGEVAQYADLAQITDRPKGHIVMRLPLEWPARRDPARTGELQAFAVEPVDLTTWKDVGDVQATAARKDYPDAWEMLRTDLYAGAQGVRRADQTGFQGDLWFRTDLQITANQAHARLHLMFPGVFGACRLYLDGVETAHRVQFPLWWQNDYKFEWDVDLSGQLKAGFNGLALACDSQGHFAGLFRRPFVYAAVAGPAPP